jgi:hypothetical protein
MLCFVRLVEGASSLRAPAKEIILFYQMLSVPFGSHKEHIRLARYLKIAKGYLKGSFLLQLQCEPGWNAGVFVRMFCAMRGCCES